MSKKKGGTIRGRPKGTKNNMRSIREKEQIVLRCINENIPFRKISKELGKCGSGNPYVALYNKKNLTEVERLKLELVKKEVECERLKKGYIVKGVGQRKEYVTINKKNSK